jgi:hypothetical protein
MRAREFVSEVAPLVTALASGLGQAAKTQQSPSTSKPGTSTTSPTSPTTTQPGTSTVAPTGTTGTGGATPAPDASKTTAPDKLTPQQLQANLTGMTPGKKFTYPGIPGQVEVLPAQTTGNTGQPGIRLRIPNVGDVTADTKTLTDLANAQSKTPA